FEIGFFKYVFAPIMAIFLLIAISNFWGKKNDCEEMCEDKGYGDCKFYTSKWDNICICTDPVDVQLPERLKVVTPKHK
ncbi:MAG: hypothetical protein OET90_11300, partial [Desulfuromonadales bacterium]|nr:hypothetical protein [Desulfuromonadales bacterium]